MKAPARSAANAPRPRDPGSRRVSQDGDDLAAFQQAFWQDLWGGESQGRGPWRDQPGAAVYRNTVRKGCVDAVLALYPAVLRLAGEAWMRAVADGFVRTHPPTSGDLQRYGDAFPAFVAQALPPGELPWLAEVAHLDRLWNESHVAADAPVLAGHEVAALDLERHPHARLQPHPAARVLRSEAWPVFSLWQAAREGRDDPNPPHWQAQAALLTRPGGAVEAMELDHGEAALFTHCLRGEPFSQALERTVADHPGTDLGVALARLLSRGAFTAIQT